MRTYTKLFFLLYIFLMFVDCSSMRQKSEKLACVITFEEGFKNDTLSFNINSCSVLKNAVITSAFSDGITNIQVYIYKNKNYFLIKLHEKDNIICRILIDNVINLNIILNNVEKEFEVDLSKGKFIGVKQSDLGIEMKQSRIQPLYD